MKKNNKEINILIVDDELAYRDVMQMILSDAGYNTDTAENAEHALVKLSQSPYHIVLTDYKMGELSGMALLKMIKDQYPLVEVILITGHGTIENAVEAMKIGAHNYIVKTQPTEILLEEMDKISRVVQSRLEGQEKSEGAFDYLLQTENTQFKKVLQTIEKVAMSDANVLILGESGVGKEMIARYVHYCSKRRDKAFIPVHCSAIADSLLESELFGHEKGAFTGASERREGLFRAAHYGTLFLDEIGDVSLSTQVKLLRTLETRKIQSIGSPKLESVDFRLICATNRNLIDAIDLGEFREDFYFRINTFVINVPPLRDRREDIPMFIDYFLHSFSKKLEKEIKQIDEKVLDYLKTHSYDGNVRQMKNMIERLVVLSEDGVIDRGLILELERMDLSLINRTSDQINTMASSEVNREEELLTVEGIKPLKEIRQETEAIYIEQTLKICKYNVSEAARKLGVSRRQLYNKIDQYNL